MTLPTSERRLTRSQARLDSNRPGTPVAVQTPSDGFSKAGRRVLAELACNDSPVVGLLPAGPPSSAKLKSSIAAPRSRRALLENSASETFTSTPVGENLLRSQVQLLLQKVGSDTSTNKVPSLRTLSHLNGFLASPSLFAAPTPLNTPASTVLTTSVPSPTMPPPAESQPPAVITSTQANARRSDAVGVSDVFSLKDANVQDQVSEVTAPQSQESPSSKHCFLPGKSIAESITSGRDQQVLQLAPLLSEAFDAANSTDLFHGKRTLQFDTPDKAPSAKDLSMVTLEDTSGASTVRELEDDEVSEWSVHVNVGSPEGKGSLIEPAELAAIAEGGAGISSGLNEHVQKMQKESSSKVNLLWARRVRQATPYRKAPPEEQQAEEEEEEEEEECAGEYYSGTEGEGEEYGDCDNLCKNFMGMRFFEKEEEEEEEAERKGLPRGEGQHIRFLYEGHDKILEAMVVEGEEARDGAIQLKGLPLPLGRHWRFSEED